MNIHLRFHQKARLMSLAACALLIALLGLNTQHANTVFAQQATAAATDSAAAAPLAQTTLLRVIHAAPGAPSVDVYLDKAAAPTIAGLAFGKATDGYQFIPAGDHNIRITAAGDSKTVVFDQTLTLPGGAAFTALAEGALSEKTFRVAILQDDLSQTASGSTRLKILHAIPDGPSVDVVTADFSTTLVSGLKYGSSITLDAPAGSYDLLVVPEGGKDKTAALLTLSGTKLAARHVYTLVALGKVTGTDKTPVASLLLDVLSLPGFAPPATPSGVPTAAATAAH